jgi:hypothetical protein
MRKKLTPEEVFVRQIRRGVTLHRLRIVVFAVLVAAVVAAVVYAGYVHQEMNARITPENLEARISFENLEQELPTLFCAFHRTAERNAERITWIYLWAAVGGLLLAALIGEVAGFNVRKSQFTISLYDRIGSLEVELAALRARLEGNGQQPGEGNA